MTAVARQMPGMSVDVEGTDQIPALAEIPLWWVSTGMGGISAMSSTTADPAAILWRSTTIPRPICAYMSPGAVVIRRGVRPARQPAPNVVPDLLTEGITHQEFAVWARSMMGGDAPDMLDI